MWKPVLTAVLCVVGVAVFAAVASDGASSARSGIVQPMGQDLFMAGGSLSVYQPVTGDLMIVGGNIDVDAPVAGDVLASGGNVRLGAEIGQSVYSAAGQLTLGGKVGRNVRIAGGQLKLDSKSEVLGNLAAAGGQIQLHGTVHGNVHVTGGRVLINGKVDGDVFAASGHVALGPKAHIAGKLRYRSGEDLEQDGAAQIDGGAEKIAANPYSKRDDARHGAEHGGAAIAGALWLMGMIALSAVLLAALPGFSSAVTSRLLERPGQSLLLGFAVFVCVPAAVLMLFITLIGLPLGLSALALYLAILPVAYVSAAIAAGDWMLRQWRPAASGRRLMRFAAAVGALLALYLVGWIPLLGCLIGFLALLGGLGALVLQARFTRLSAQS
jgi:cytoskeletal protein CcmA (bactofilin family)